mgnify:FL=1
MGLIEELAAHLDTESTRFTLGTNLALNFMPDEPNTCASMVEYGGVAPDYSFAGDLPVNENARVAVTCRSTSSATARTNIGAAWVALQRVTNETLSSHSWLRCAAAQSPFLLERDAQGRVEYRANFDCMRRTTST